MSAADTPAMVPPVPAPDTNACSRPPVCCRISRPGRVEPVWLAGLIV